MAIYYIKPFLDFVHLLLKYGSRIEATHLSPEIFKINNQELPKYSIVNYISLNAF